MKNNLPTSTLSVNAKINNNNKSKKIKMKKNALDPVDFEEEKRKDPKYKTELCKSWIETHFCAYGNKCRFAHGKEELSKKTLCNNYKKKSCKTFSELGYCPYGSRCSFKHFDKKISDVCFPYYYINTFIIQKKMKRLQIFEEICKNSNDNEKYFEKNKVFDNNINNKCEKQLEKCYSVISTDETENSIEEDYNYFDLKGIIED